MKKMLAAVLAGSMLLTAAAALAEDAVTGASQVVVESEQMTQEEIRALALDYLRGWPLTVDENGEKTWAYREMYQIATVKDGEPHLSSVEFVIDPENMHLYACSENGTEKVVDLEDGGRVVMYWYHQIPEEEYIPQVNDYFSSYGVQIKGEGRLMTGEEENFVRAAGLYIQSLYGAAMWNGMTEEQQAGIIARVGSVNKWIEIVPDEYIVNTLSWAYNVENSRRPQYYDPTSPTFGKSVRQVYKVVE